jgi:2-oxoglutarate ferredoxin oxidoreductase subunit beta
VISPCVAFNNHAGSTKSYDYVREHNEAVNRIDFMPQYAPGEVTDVEQHDGTFLRLRKIAQDYDATDKLGAMSFIQKHQAQGEVVTGLLYVDSDASDLHTALHTPARALNSLHAADLCPGVAALDRINHSLR